MEKALINIFREHEEELESYCPDYAIRVQELMQKDLIAGDRVGSRYSRQFAEDVTMRCGGVNETAQTAAEPVATAGTEGDESKDNKDKGSATENVSANNKEKGQKSGFSSAPKLSLEERIKVQLNEKMAEDREISQMVAHMEEQILNNSDEHEVELPAEAPVSHEVEESPAKAVCSDDHFIPMCDDCGDRHLHGERECNVCMEVHSGCCEL